jgi:putative lipoprotein
LGARLRPFLFLIIAQSALVPVVLSAQEPPPPPASSPVAPGPAVKRAIEWKQFSYTCEGGAKLKVYLHNETVKVVFKDKVYLMRQTPSGSGTRYSDGNVVWWSKGNGGFLQADTPDGNGEMIVKGCELEEPLNSAAMPASVSGTVSYLVRMALPSDAMIEVKLLDVSRADAPATVIAEEKITLGDRQVPVPFELKFDPGKIEAKHLYSVSGRILVDGQLRFTSDKAYPVLTRGNPTHVELLLKQVSSPADTPKT